MTFSLMLIDLIAFGLGILPAGQHSKNSSEKLTTFFRYFKKFNMTINYLEE